MPQPPIHTGLSRRSLLLGIGAVGLAGCVEQTGSPPYRPVTSFMSLRYEVTVRQAFDFSCGGATVATLMTHHLGYPTTEVQVLDELRGRYPDTDWESLQKRGFSLEDLIWVVHRFNLEAQAAKIDPNELENLDGPVIVHLNKGTFEHFTVLRTRKGGRTFLSDPIEGAVVMSNAEFDNIYTGSALAIWEKGKAPPRNTKLSLPGPFAKADESQRGVGELRPPWISKGI